MCPKVIQDSATGFCFFAPGIWPRLGPVPVIMALKTMNFAKKLFIKYFANGQKIAYISPVLINTKHFPCFFGHIYQLPCFFTRIGKGLFQYYMFAGLQCCFCKRKMRFVGSCDYNKF